MYEVGTRVYVESDALQLAGHGYITRPGQHHRPGVVLVVQCAPAAADSVAMRWVVRMDDSSMGTLGGFVPVTVRPDQWLCPPQQVCAACRRERTHLNHTDAAARRRPPALQWTAKASDLDDPYQPPSYDDSGATFGQVYRQLAWHAREADEALVPTWNEWDEDSWRLGYDIRNAQGRAVATAVITGSPELP